MNSFHEPVEIHIPRLYELKGKIHGNKIEKIERMETVEEINLTPYKSGKITGFCGTSQKNHSMVFLHKKTSAKLDGHDLILAPECGSAVELHEMSKAEQIRWLRPKPAPANSISIEHLQALSQQVRASWKGKFQFQEEVRDHSGVIQPGLRPPQIGALHAVLAHWSVSTKPATIVMPTGTGKTETMLALLTAVGIERLMVVVPNAALRAQIAEKFLTLGILKSARALADSADLPIVATLEHRPKSEEEVDEVFLRANVIITTIQVAGQCAPEIQKRMAKHCSHLFIDEAHHIASSHNSILEL